MPARCPQCATPIRQVAPTGPDRVQLDPCGHQVSERSLADLDWQDRTAEVQDAGDGDLYIADGGTDETRPTYDPTPSTRGLPRRECRNCGRPGFEHKQRANPSDGKMGFTFVCPDEPEDRLTTDGGTPPFAPGDRVELPRGTLGTVTDVTTDCMPPEVAVDADDGTTWHGCTADLRPQPLPDGGQPVQDSVSEDDEILEAVAQRGERYVIFELLGRSEDLFMGVQDLRVNDDVEQVDVDSSLEDVVDELEKRVDNLVVDREHAWTIAEGRVDRARVDVAMDRWGADDG